MSAGTDGSAGIGDEARELLPVASAARTRAAVMTLVRPDRLRAVVALVVLIAATAVGLLVQPLLGQVVDIVADRRPADDLTLPVVLLVVVAVVQGAATTLGLTRVARLGETVLARLREQFVDRALSLPADRLERAGSGDLTARVTGDVARVAEAVRSALPELARSVLAIVLTLAAMAVLDWRFLLAALVAVPVQALTARWYVRRAVTLYARQRVATGAQQQQLLETIGGASTVRGYLLETEHTERVAARSRAAVDLTMRGVRLVLGFYGRLHVAEYLGLGAVLITGWLLVGDGAVSVGTATAAALYFHSLFGPVNAALVLLDDAQQAGAGLARLVGVTDLHEIEGVGGRPVDGAGRVPAARAGGAAVRGMVTAATSVAARGTAEAERHSTAKARMVAEGTADARTSAAADTTVDAAGGTDNGAGGGLDAANGAAIRGKVTAKTGDPAQGTAGASRRAGGDAVAVSRVSHAYGAGPAVLHDVSLVLAVGEQVALVGTSGAGKSTLARLVAGVQAPTGGSVRIGGRGEERGADVVLVTQEVHVFAGTLRDDLRLARADATDAELRDALSTVHALSWAEALPDGLDTVVGEGGHQLDAARAQQLALARLVLTDPPVAVLDEATAEAGSAGARVLERSAAAALAGRTSLVVAHRLTQAVAADRVVVLDGGRVVESGTHEALRDAGGPYSALWTAWSGSRTASPP
ncbi:ABC transporter ATP-binding protein [Streptomyces sp. NPDC057137]|uniref:ABC transporter ATP-binding protein n=1 Tax=Streptomyces sp. NPDC057137 TaxID=3346030 RepID=UPI00363DBBFF